MTTSQKFNPVLAALEMALAGKNVASFDGIMVQVRAICGMDEKGVLQELQNLKLSGQIDFPARGRNCRTHYSIVSIAPESIAPESTAPESTVPESTAPESIAPESIAPESIAPGPKVMKAPLVKGVDLPNVRPLEDDEMYGDTYFSRVAARQTPCFGGWTPRAKTCDGCSLRGNCRNAAIAELGVMAARWVPKAPPEFVRFTAPEPESTAPEPESTVPEPESTAPSIGLAPTGTAFEKAPFAVFCKGCSQIVASGADMVLRKFTESLPGLYHPACAPPTISIWAPSSR